MKVVFGAQLADRFVHHALKAMSVLLLISYQYNVKQDFIVLFNKLHVQFVLKALIAQLGHLFIRFVQEDIIVHNKLLCA